MFPDFVDTRPLRFWLDDGLNWVVRNWGDEFEAAAYPLLVMLNTIEDALLAVPWWLIIVAFAALAFGATRKWTLPIIVVVGLVFMGLMELWEDSVKTMALMISATVTAIVFSIPLGIVMARSEIVQRIVTPILDLMQTMPSFVYLIPTVMIFGPGKIPALLATIVYAAPPLVRLTNLGIRQVEPSVMEAAQAFGASPRQRLFGVQIPLALPTILAGVNQTTMMALAMVVIASMIGAGGAWLSGVAGALAGWKSAGAYLPAWALWCWRLFLIGSPQAYGKQLQEQIGLAGDR